MINNLIGGATRIIAAFRQLTAKQQTLALGGGIVVLIGLLGIAFPSQAPAPEPPAPAHTEPAAWTAQPGHHSDLVPSVVLPKGAHLDPYAAGNPEVWYPLGSQVIATKDMAVLLPVDQPLDGLAPCPTRHGGGSTYWAWASPTESVSVSVMDINDTAVIMISRAEPGCPA